MLTNRRIPLAALAATVVATFLASTVVTACAPAPAVTVTATPIPAVTPSATPVVTPSPTPTFVAHPALADLWITTQGLLPLAIGRDAATNPGAAMITWDETACYLPDMGLTTDTGRWVANYPEPRPFTLDGQYAPAIYRIDIADPALMTPEFIHLGSTLGELQAAYPGLHTGTPGYLTTPYWISDDYGYVVFEVGSGTVDGTPGPNQIWWIRVLARDSNPDYTIAGSENIAGGCGI